MKKIDYEGDFDEKIDFEEKADFEYDFDEKIQKQLENSERTRRKNMYILPRL